MLRFWLLLFMTLNALQKPCVVLAIAVDVDGPAAAPYDVDSVINQLVYPNPVYEMHVAALRNQLRQMLRNRQLDAAATAAAAAAADNAANDDEFASNAATLDYDYPDEDKRSVAALAAQGLLNPKRSLATLAKNGQLPSSSEPDDMESTNEDKRYVGALARSGGFVTGTYGGKRNIGTLARDYQLPQNGKRNLATLARLGLLTKGDGTKRNMAAVARYNSHGRLATNAPGEKRNIGALKASPVHGIQQQKRDEDEVYLPASLFHNNMDYVDYMPQYWLYPSYADLDWGDFGRAQKRFLDTSRDPELFGIENAPHSNDSEYEPYIGGIDPGDPKTTAYEHINNNHATSSSSSLQAPLETHDAYGPPQEKRHIGSVYRSGFLPSYRSLRSTIGSYGGYGGGRGGYSGGRFSRSGRARQFVEYYPQQERLLQPIASVCKRCYLPYRPVVHWGGAAGIRGRLFKKYFNAYTNNNENVNSIMTNSLPITFNRPPIAYASTMASNNYYTNGKNKKYINQKSAYRAQLRTGAGASSTSSLGRQRHWGTPPRITAMHRSSFRRPEMEFNGKNAI
ncbi:uncharacterized protein Nplp1 [Eurosta solidaginis]|uniref:uncharacterized protein Nplp1 n=1 Tax=Eurosta solidaginis TaxID=178769 RepID=UPI0035315DA6